MNEKSLLSLREIACELNLNYKTILNFKNQLGQFLPGVFDGKHFKYFPASKEILGLTAALRDEGYTFTMIQEIFLRKRSVINDPQIKEWVCECIDSHGHYWVGMDESEQTGMTLDGPEHASMDQNGSACASMGENGLVCAGMDKSELGEPGMNKDESEQAGMDEDKPAYPGPDQDGLAQPGADIATQIQAGMDQAKQVWLKEVEAQVGSLLTNQAGSIQGILQKMATQSNIAITALCESFQDIRNGILALDARLSRLEQGLDVETADPVEVYEVDAGNYQVDLPEIFLPDMAPPLAASLESTPEDGANSDDHDTATIRASIVNGIPDREVLVDWIMEKRQEDEAVYSYSTLARIMSESGIPTLSGREKWSRSTVRNLLVRTLANRG